MPQHQVSHNETYTDSLIRKFEEVNEHFDNTINGMYLFSLTTDISTNETFTYHKAMKEKDRMKFIQAMENEVYDHESRNHWSIVGSTLPDNAKPIKATWSFERKRRPDGTLLKHKARLFVHGGV